MNTVLLLVALSPACPPVAGPVYYPAPVVWMAAPAMPARIVYPAYPVWSPPMMAGPVVYPAPLVPTQPVQEKSLYERLGGDKAIEAVIDDFVPRAAANPKVNFTRKGTAAEWDPTPENVARLKKGLVDLIGMVTGGPQKYSGGDMKTVHAGMKISNAEFDALAGDLVATLKQFNVPQAEQQELLGIIAATREAIVEKK